MLIRMLENADGVVGGQNKALFAGQTYEVEDARHLITSGRAVAVGTKAVHGPPEDKGLKARAPRKRK